MALGGGAFTAQTKILPGTYINFVSVAAASSALSERGIAAFPLELHWGPEQEVFTVTQEEFRKSPERFFAAPGTAAELLPVRELFRHARCVHFWRLNSGGEKAACAFAQAKYSGVRGNDLKIAVAESETGTPEAKRYDVTTYLGTQAVDEQKAVADASELVPNDFVSFLPEAELQATAAAPLTGGSDGAVEEDAWQAFLDGIEPFSFHALGCLSADAAVTERLAAYCREQRDKAGKKFQAVLFRTLADCEGVVSVKNGLAGDSENPALAAWATGVVAATAVNASATNLAYDGECAVDTRYTQKELEQAITEGSWALHLVDGKPAVLADRNTFVSAAAEKSTAFSDNQTIRVIDQIANDIAVVFRTRFLGRVPNDAAGRVSLWNEIVKHHRELESLRAIEAFSPDDVTVAPGETKKAVAVSDAVTVVGAMEQLYMTVYVQ